MAQYAAEPRAISLLRATTLLRTGTSFAEVDARRRR
jgi:hypothetical protein